MKTRQKRRRRSKRRAIKAKGYVLPSKTKPAYSEEIANLTLSYLRGHWER